MEIINIVFILSLISHFVFLTIVLYNYITAPQIFNSFKDGETVPALSVLIPARNEETNIEAIISSLINQTYLNYELIVLDDNSTDKTLDIVHAISKENPKIIIIKGKQLPENWLGKNWACYQLYQHAKSDFLLFIDADVRLRENALSYSFWLMKKYNLSLLSVFPTQLTNSFGERLIVPLMHWLLLTFLPLRFVFKSANNSFSAANGQFMLIRKDAYELIGTHKDFRDRVVEDMELVRVIKKKKLRTMTCLGNETISASMYNSFKESFSGFEKNFFPGFNLGRLYFIITISLFLVLFLLPYITVFWNPYNLVLIVLIVCERLFVSKLTKENAFLNIILHPVQILIMFVIGLSSVSKKRKVWKDRVI